MSKKKSTVSFLENVQQGPVACVESIMEQAQVAENPPTSPDVQELALLVKRLVRALRKVSPDNQVANDAMQYLKSKALTGNPLRCEDLALTTPQPAPDVRRLVETLTEINNWLVCACIARPEDMAQSFQKMLDLTEGTLAQFQGK